jgi:sterol desaturase/sphingolipid hydroxylase (fatty acid hydroxylase superfamily)
MTLTQNELYEASLKSRHGTLQRAGYALWVVFGLTTLTAIAWAEPWSARLFTKMLADGASPWLIHFVLMPVVMTLRAVLIVESIGYAYHRFFQHLGWLTRKGQVIRRSQRFHWIHHMIIYPIGRLYQRRVEYVPSEKGLALSWAIPAIIVMSLFLATNGLHASTFVFLVALPVYAQFIVSKTHSRFHEIDHPWANSRYFHWLEDIHLLHHWDQRKNFTIDFPVMDILFGTYMSPRKHKAELHAAKSDDELTVSDFINWRYLLTEATPAEYAAFISAARRQSRSVKKVRLLMGVLENRIATVPGDAQAQDLQRKAFDLLAEIEKPGSTASA